MKDKKLIGYVFGYKDSEKINDNSFRIRTVTGTSEIYPKQFATMKDFFADAIREGDFTPLFIEPRLAEEAFAKEIKIMTDEFTFWADVQDERRHYYEFEYTVEQFIALNALSMMKFHFIPQAFADKETELAVKTKLISPYFEGYPQPLEMVIQDFETGSAAAYDAETAKLKM